MKAAEVVDVFKASEKEFFDTIKEIDEKANIKKHLAFDFFTDNLSMRLKDVDFGTILEVLGDKNLSDKQRAAIAAAYANNHSKEETGLLASLLGVFMIS